MGDTPRKARKRLQTYLESKNAKPLVCLALDSGPAGGVFDVILLEVSMSREAVIAALERALDQVKGYDAGHIGPSVN